MQRVKRTSVTPRMASRSMGATCRAARAMIANMVALAIGALYRREGRISGSSISMRLTLSRMSAAASGGQRIRSWSAGRTRTVASVGPGRCRGRETPRTRAPLRLRNGMSVSCWPIAGCDGPMDASTTRSSGELAISRLARPRSAPSSSLNPSSSAWSAATTSSSPAASSNVGSGLRVRWPLLLTASSRTPERCHPPILLRLRPTQGLAAPI